MLILHHTKAVALAVPLAIALLCGCSTNSVKTEAASAEQGDFHVVAPDDYRDPLGGVNRVMFAFNDKLYRYLLFPVGEGYQAITPDPLERSFGRFFRNLKSPIVIVNHGLQGQGGEMGSATARFLINSTIGLLGLFDVADSWFDLQAEDTGFAQTLAHYDIGYGLYLVLPVLGPSDLRDTTGVFADFQLNPVRYLLENPDRLGVQAFDQVQSLDSRPERYRELYREADDAYLFFRNLHLQNTQRDAAYDESSDETP